MKVKDHKLFRLFEYVSLPSKNFQLGQILINTEHLSDLENFGNPIGVVIQTHDDNECRTDMYGNTCTETSRLATLEEIQLYRPDLIKQLEK